MRFAPVATAGQPPSAAFHLIYLAGAIAIGATLRLVDSLNRSMTTAPSGNFAS